MRKDENNDVDPNIAMFRSIFDDPSSLTGNPAIDGPILNAQAVARISAHGNLIGGLRESLIALLRSNCEIAPYVRSELASALERGASDEDANTPGSEGWSLKIVGLSKQKSQGERTRTRRDWAKIGEFIRRTITEDEGPRGSRERALKAAQSKFGVGREKAEKSLKYFEDREKWVAERERIIGEEYVDKRHKAYALEASRIEFDQLHARSASAPAKQIARLRDYYNSR